MTIYFSEYGYRYFQTFLISGQQTRLKKEELGRVLTSYLLRLETMQITGMQFPLRFSGSQALRE